MRKLTLFAVALCFAAFSFAQNQGQWSFGAGGNFTAPGAGDDNFNANIGYFAIDGLMLSFSFNMTMDYDTQIPADADLDGLQDVDANGTAIWAGTVATEGGFDWGAALRYYAVDNMFVEAELSTGTGEDPDLYFAGGVSLPLGFEDRLWFEPMIKLTMPGEEYGPESQNTLGLAWAFRYTF